MRFFILFLKIEIAASRNVRTIKKNLQPFKVIYFLCVNKESKTLFIENLFFYHLFVSNWINIKVQCMTLIYTS